jgi:hypothetical protein
VQLSFLYGPGYYTSGIDADGFLKWKFSNPTNVYRTVWGISNFLAALGMHGRTRTHPSS